MGHLRENGFEVAVIEMDDVVPIKVEHGITPQLSGCHTALVGDYVIEGHVPASSIARLLEEAPEVAGLAVPGMPIGSPGMEGPNPERYNVLAFDKDGSATVFESH